MSKFEVKDRVAVYGCEKLATAARATVLNVLHNGAIEVISDCGEVRAFVHSKQCRKLKRKERRRVWVTLTADGFIKDYVTKASTKPRDKPNTDDEWIEFIEAKPKKKER